MAYDILTPQNIVSYILAIDSLRSFFGTDDISVDEIGDGNLNYVYILKSKKDAAKALIVKQAVPYLRCVGETFPLSRERMNYEIRALNTFYERSPEFIPKIHYADESMSLVVMQYLGKHIILRHGLMRGLRYPKLADDVSTYLANALFYTSSLYLQSDKKRELIDRFNSNTELCKLTEDFVFTTAYMEHETNDNKNVKDNPLAAELFADMPFKEKVLCLKYKFMTQNDALLHGDLHTGSLMVNQDETYVIDPEFAFVGPFGFDIGALLANFVNAYIHHTVVTADTDYQSWLLESIDALLEGFLQKFLRLWDQTESSALITPGFLDDATLSSFKNDFIRQILRDTVGFAGCKMARRVFGVAGVAEIRGIEDKEKRAQAEAMALSIAKRFVMEHENIGSTKDIRDLITDER
ncbi:S-methyl-5-thioribose kinase [Sulfurimonas sp. HSL-1716]|uniref:S-methyl-5-thioribose kinase n=1 Tax=Hydrocurvibacter sulfurireducens TaxID=3131937 RepID=UPI0031F9D4FA